MPRYKLTIEYDGSVFAGWQRQDNAPSVQATLEAAAEALDGASAQVIGAGRTDAGRARGERGGGSGEQDGGEREGVRTHGDSREDAGFEGASERVSDADVSTPGGRRGEGNHRVSCRLLRVSSSFLSAPVRVWLEVEALLMQRSKSRA